MPKYFMLATLFTLSTSAIAEPISGVWRDKEMDIYISFYEPNKVYQCRVADDDSIITAFGDQRDNEIIWGRVSAYEKNGNEYDFYKLAPGFTTWGKETLSRNKNEILISASQGKYPFIRVDKMPETCREKLTHQK